MKFQLVWKKLWFEKLLSCQKCVIRLQNVIPEKYSWHQFYLHTKKVNLTNFEQLQFIPTIKKCFSTNCTYSCNVFWGINSLIVWYIIMLVPCTVKFAVCVFVSRTLEQGPPAAKEKHDIYSQNSFISIQFSIIWQFDKET